MKTRSINLLTGLGLLAFALLSGLSPIQAETLYTYDVDFPIATQTVTGDIVLNCDDCLVTASATWTSSLWLNGSMLNGLTYTTPNLFASPTAITFEPTTYSQPPLTGSSYQFIFTGITESLFFGDNIYFVGSGNTGCLMPPSTEGEYGICSNGSLTLETTTGPLVFATAPDLSAIPEPPSIPLFATGLGALGLLGWRRKRKARAVAA